MRRLIFSLSALLLLWSCGENDNSPQAGDADIEKMLLSMSIEEKVGQMTNLTLSTVAKEVNGKVQLDTAKLRDALVNHHVGSLQNVIGHAYSLEEWHGMLNTMQKITLEETEHKVPFLYCIDAVHGANYVYGATLFPHNIGLAATRNLNVIEAGAAITAAETRAAGIRYNFSPVLDVGRSQHWSRFGETFGEDVYLVTKCGAASIRGYEGNNVADPSKVAACMKHFVGYSTPQNGKDRAPAYIPEIVLREYFLPPFQQAVDMGTHTLMVNSGEVNGVPVHASKFLLTEVLRIEMGYTGVVITDWQDILKMHERHQVAASHKDAVKLAVNAGIDMCIVPFDFSFYNDLLALVKEGEITEERIDQSVRRILKLKKELGLFENPYIEAEAIKNFAKPVYYDTALKAAHESMTLLKNNASTLPLSPESNVLLTGPLADSLSPLYGAWSYCWQGDNESVYPDSLPTIADKMKVANYVNWRDASLLSKAQQSDVIVAVVGEKAYAETPGNIPSLDFDQEQVDFIKKLSKTGKPIVLVLLEGRPRIIREIEPLCKSILLAYWPGTAGAEAISDVLYGKVNPSGKLPFTYPRHASDLITYDHKLLDEAKEVADPYSYNFEFNPQYEFGHGLSYSHFGYSNFELSTDTLVDEGSLVVKITVTNEGPYDGAEVVELYTKDRYATVTPSVKRLRKFEKVYLTKGESKRVSFLLTPKELEFVDQKMHWNAESGDFDVLCGGLTKSFFLKL